MKGLLALVIVSVVLVIAVLGYGYLTICTPGIAHGIC